MTPQVLLVPDDERRLETGPMRYNDDWCGIFIRGDEALGFASKLLVRDGVARQIVIDELRELLMSCAEWNLP